MSDPADTPALSLLVLRVADLQVSRRFYEALGLEFLEERHGKGPEHLAADLGGTVFELYPLGSKASTSAARVGIRVRGLDSLVPGLSALGGQVVTPAEDSPWGRRAVVRDPDGHTLELSEGGGAES